MRARIHHLWITLLNEHTSPARLASAVWLGVIIGATPFFGFHFVITVALGFLFRLNKLVIYAAAQISIPPLVPFLGYASIQLGHFVLHRSWHSLGFDDFKGMGSVKAFFTEWLVGGLVFGFWVGAVAAAITYSALRNRRRTPEQAALQRASARFAAALPQYAWYARIKYRMDPVYLRIAAHVAEHTHTVDLGAGLGMLGVLLGELGNRSTTGIEWDADKVAAGQSAARGLSTSLQQGDVSQLQTVPQADAVTLVDVLHYFDDTRIGQVLDVAIHALKPGGKLLVREGDLGAGGGAGWTRFLENAAVKLGWNKAPNVRFLSRDRLVELLAARGLSVAVERASGPAHPGNLLFVGTKPATALHRLVN